jgi:hypothetical protein
MSPSEIAERLQRELDAQPRPTMEDIARLEARVREFERRYEMPSDEVHEAIEDHRLHETADVVQWIFAIRALERARAR